MSTGGDFPADWELIEQEDRPWLTRFLRGRVPADAVEDVLQDTWLSFWRLDAGYEAAGRRHALLQRIAARRAVDWHRVRPPVLRDEIPEAVDPDSDFTGHLLKRLGVTPDTLMWRRIVSLVMLAEYFGVPVGTIKSRLAHEKQNLVRRLDDWHDFGTAFTAACAHARSDVLAVSPCPRCRTVRATWQALIARADPCDGGFQRTYFSVESDFGLWLDAMIDLRHLISPDACLWGNSLAVLGPVRRLRNAHGADLSRRVHPEIVGGQEVLLFPIRREDGRRVSLTQHGTARQARSFHVRPSESAPRGNSPRYWLWFRRQWGNLSGVTAYVVRDGGGSTPDDGGGTPRSPSAGLEQRGSPPALSDRQGS